MHSRYYTRHPRSRCGIISILIQELVGRICQWFERGGNQTRGTAESHHSTAYDMAGLTPSSGQASLLYLAVKPLPQSVNTIPDPPNAQSLLTSNTWYRRTRLVGIAQYRSHDEKVLVLESPRVWSCCEAVSLPSSLCYIIRLMVRFAGLSLQHDAKNDTLLI